MSKTTNKFSPEVYCGATIAQHRLPRACYQRMRDADHAVS